MKSQSVKFPAIEALSKSRMQKIKGGFMSRKETLGGTLRDGRAYTCDSELYDDGLYVNTTYTLTAQ